VRIAGFEGKTLALYGGLALGAYVLIRYVVPKMVGGLATGAGKTAGSVVMAAPRAIDSALEQMGLPPQSLEKMGGAIGQGIYAATHVFSKNPFGDSLSYTVMFPDGARHSIGESLIDSRGRFRYGTLMYQIKDDAAGKHYATRL
jgi:hypothetical protein